MFAAQTSTGTATSTTAHCITSASHAGSKDCTTPSTGASTNSPASAVSGPFGPGTTGTAISATAAIPA